MILTFIKKNPKITFNIFIVFIERLLQLVLTISSFGIIANSISLTDNGKFFYAYSWSAVFLTISFYAGAELIVPKLSKYHYLKKNIIATGFYLRIFYAIVCFIIGLIFCLLFLKETDIKIAFLIFLIGPLFSEVLVVFACWFTATGRNIWFSGVRTLGLLARFIVVYVFSKVNDINFYYFSLAYFIEAIVIGMLAVYIYYKHPNNCGWGKFNYKVAKSMFWHGLIIGIGLTFNYIFLKLDRILLEKLVDYKILGSYSAIMQINESWFNVGVAICNILAPYFIFTKETHGVKNKFYINAIALTIFALIFSFIINIFSVKIVSLVLGVSYLPNTYLLELSCWFSIFIFLQQLCSMWWLRQKKYFFQIFIWIIGISCLGIATLLLVPTFGLYGMIYAIFIAYTVMLTYQFYIIKNESA